MDRSLYGPSHGLVSAATLLAAATISLVIWLPAGEAMSAEPLEARGEREIVELHAFFQGWYRGELEGGDFERFAAVLAEEFVIVLPGPRVLDREAILDGVRGQHDSDPRAEISIRNVRLQQKFGSTAIFTYEEWQSRRGEPARGVLSTVVFGFDDETPNGLVWLHVHESELPGDGAS